MDRGLFSHESVLPSGRANQFEWHTVNQRIDSKLDRGNPILAKRFGPLLQTFQRIKIDFNRRLRCLRVA